MYPIKQDLNDLYARYDRSFLEYKGKVYLCKVMDDDGEGPVYFHLTRPNDPNGSVIEVDPYDKNLSSKSVPLGYVNTEEKCTYIERRPERQWRQGVSEYTLIDYLGDAVYSDPTDWMLQNEYPTLEEASYLLDTLQRKQVAVSRNIMIEATTTRWKYNVFCKKKHVGDIPNAKASFAIELFSEKLGRVIQPYLNGFPWKVKKWNK